MAQHQWPTPPFGGDRIRHQRAPIPIVFPEEAQVPEGKRHLVLRTFLFRLLRSALGPGHSVGSDQFVYWNASNPQRCLAPDLFVKMGVVDSSFGSWKTWEQGGVPEMAVEIVSPNEGDGVPWNEKLARYHELGVQELLRFDPEASEGQRLRAWDRIQGDLVERHVEADRTPSLTLGLVWCVVPVETEPVALRLVDDEDRLLQVPEEVEARGRAEEARGRAEEARGRAEEARGRAEEARGRAEEARGRAEEARGRAEAEARVRELEALLASQAPRSK